MGCCQNHQLESQEDVNLQLLDPILGEYKGVRGSVIPVLQKTQDIYGYLPRASFSYIANKLGVKEAKIYGVATFYAQFRMEPIGEYLIMLCQGTACHVNGADRIQMAIEEELKIKDGETTEDGKFTLMIMACPAAVHLLRSMIGKRHMPSLRRRAQLRFSVIYAMQIIRICRYESRCRSR